MVNKAPEKKSHEFENSLVKLEKIISDMESDGLSLEQSLGAFENGIKLAHEAQKMLTEAEQKVQALIDVNGKLVTSSFSENEVKE